MHKKMAVKEAAMEMLVILVGIIGLIVLFDVAALKWGRDSNLEGWTNGSYDPRNNWHSLEYFQPTVAAQPNPAGVAAPLTSLTDFCPN